MLYSAALRPVAYCSDPGPYDDDGDNAVSSREDPHKRGLYMLTASYVEEGKLDIPAFPC